MQYPLPSQLKTCLWNPCPCHWPPLVTDPADGVKPAEVELGHVFLTTLGLNLSSCTMNLRMPSFFSEEADLNMMV